MIGAATKQHAAFFRQSGWLAVSNVACGVLLWSVHFLSKRLPDAEYGIVGTLLALIVCIPSGPLQLVFVHQAAADLAGGRRGQLAAKARISCFVAFCIWLVAVVAIIGEKERILARWHIANPVVLWVTLLAILCSLWLPVLTGLLQGKQDFFWLGWSSIFNALGRAGIASVAVLFFGAWAVGVMTGVLSGFLIALAIVAWQVRDLLMERPEQFDGRSLLGEAIPLVLGFGACQFLTTADTMFVNSFFSAAQTAHYAAAGTLCRALVWVVTPLTAVMFPKIVHSAARSEQVNLLGLTLVSTAVVVIVGAIGLCLLGPVAIRIVYTPSYLPVATSLLPWYAGAMLPLSLANVMVSNLLAQSSFRVVPLLVLLAVAYGLTLRFLLASQSANLVLVLQILAVFNTGLLAVCAWFTWAAPRKP